MINKIKIFLEMIKFEHTVFALPFAYIAAFLAEEKLVIDQNLLWITLAMVGGRTTAMALNRIIDRRIDAQNPRTKNRALPAGLIKVTEAWRYTVVFTMLFFLSAYNLSDMAFKISPLCLLAFIFYSYTKRFTWLSHFFLGLTIGMAPLAAWIGISNGLSAGVVALGLGVAFWVAGFDIIYACDDVVCDRAGGLFSIPARFGIRKALRISAIAHGISILLFVATGLIIGLGISYWAGLSVAAVLMYKQHELVATGNLSQINVAFYKINCILSIVMFVAVILDVGIRSSYPHF